MKCPSCDGSGSSYLDVDSKLYGEISIHEHCGSCAGTGYGEVAEAARGIQYQFRHLLGGESDVRETIARYVASAVSARERSER